jgi:8-oxo-dGTP pyrophosphatase MutT (NUDIX family)
MKKGTDYIGVGVCCFCHDGKGNVVLIKRSVNARDEHGRWDIVGGGIEFGDTPEETVRKEVKEELDADVLDFEFMGFFDAHREHEGKPTHWVQLAFNVLVDPKQVKINEPHKFDDLGWFNFETLPTPMHSQFPKFREKFGDKLLK